MAVGVWVGDNGRVCVKVRVHVGVCDGACVSFAVGVDEKVAVNGLSVRVAVPVAIAPGEQEDTTQVIKKTERIAAILEIIPGSRSLER